MDTESIFHTKPGFCGDCGAILPLVTSKGDIVCYTCGKQYSCDALGKDIIQFTINFNSVKETAKNIEDEKKRKNIEADDGPVVERKCTKCGNNKMSYATVQLRSADEGQTVFYTCCKCKHKEFENS